MKKKFNDGWQFACFALDTEASEIQRKTDGFTSVRLPHDWLIGKENLYEDGLGCYRKAFTWKKKKEELVFLRFDGIYMDSTIYLNGKWVGEWKYGYTTFEVELTEALLDGDNLLEVFVRYQAPNSRWYSGAGIYRNVWLKTVHTVHLVSDGIYVSTSPLKNGDYSLLVETELAGVEAFHGEALFLRYELKPLSGGTDYLYGKKQLVTGERVCLETVIEGPELWDVEHPFCYELMVSLLDGERELQREALTIGFKEAKLTPKEGFLLNGRKLKLNGVCDHHDLGCLGSAFHTEAMERKLQALKRMGANAIRLSHNMPAPEVMELCDRMGFLVVSEAFDMWESSKTPYDYARFFKDWYKRDVERWVRRDRNHPCLILWSIGNEIHDTHASERGQVLTRLLMEEVQRHDMRNAKVTIGSNYMPWENARKCADIVKIAGYNYGEAYYDEHHKEHPDWVIYGSETGSVVQSRGIYHFPYRQPVLNDEDEQCSALGNSTTSWGAASAEACLKAEIDHSYSCGQFIWTGTDYIGEPTPYHTRNSYFGQIDTAGFEKDSFYIYQSGWTDWKEKPMIHLFPYWDFNEGQLIDVRACSNAPKVELLLNGESLGIRELDQKQGTRFAGNWQIPYTKGTLLALAYDENGAIVAKEEKTSFGDTETFSVEGIQIKSVLNAEEEHLVFYTITARDKEGNPVENANDRVEILVSHGELVGTDNGDSTDTDSYHSSTRRLFSGKLLAVCRSKTPEKIQLKVIPVKEKQVRNIYLTSDDGTRLTPQKNTVFVRARISPADAKDQELFFSIVDDAGIPLKNAELYKEEGGVRLVAKSDGKFRLRCCSRSGTNQIRIISSLEFEIQGMGKAFTDPYEFVSAGLYSFKEGVLSNGNEHGVATARDGVTVVGFSDLDFGTDGSDELTLPIFALSADPYSFQIMEHRKQADGQEEKELLGSFLYQKPSIWNVYQEETYRLSKRLKGVTTISFEWTAKVHMKGFTFTRQEKAWQELKAVECDRIYGDSFRKEEQAIFEIGNNVTLGFLNLDFGEAGTDQIRIKGHTALAKNTIVLQFEDENGENRRIVEFLGNAADPQKMEEQTFSFEKICGRKNVNFVFLPGCNFDFASFQFQKAKEGSSGRKGEKE